ncbi:Vam6/Vps39-like protein [Blattella germanica]|nr:Vam6/Vps39-like protein [Blattella germanica]
MHDAYELALLLKSPVQIESIAAYDDNLLVGTKQGHLLMYSVSYHYGDPKPNVQLLRYHKSFSKKPVLQLAVVPEYQILVSLSDNAISVHDITVINFPVISVMSGTKGATLFTLDIKKQISMTGETTALVRMCVAVKRKLQLFYWKNNEFRNLQDDLNVSDVPRALAWCEETICVGLKGEYRLVKLDNKQKDLFPIEKHPEPLITKLSDSTFALGKDMQSIFMNTEGHPIQKYAVKWSEAPLGMSYDEPYLVGVLAECVEVRTVEPCLFIQSLPVEEPRFITRCRQGLVYIASPGQVYCLLAIPVARQIHVLLENKEFQLALKLTIQTLYAFDLFNNKQFHKSMKEFLKLGTDPYEVIRLFPELLPQQSVGQEGAEQREKLQDRDLENGLLALIEFLTEVRHKLMGDSKPENNEKNNVNHKSTQQLLQIIDTTLLKCYLQTNDALVAPLLRLNRCHLGETEKTLKKHHKFSELIILYQTKGLHRKALELLQKQADQPDSTLHGYERTLQYLQHIGWVLDANPEEGLKMFTEDIAEVEQLPRPKVLDYLLRTHKNLVIPYLEHVVHSWEDTNSIFHNALVHQYRENCQQLLGSLSSPTKQDEVKKIRHKLLQFLETSAHYTPETVLVYSQGSPGYDEVYILLIKMLINPPDSSSWLVMGPHSTVLPPPPMSDLEKALSLLEEHASKIHPLKALSVLPDHVPVLRIRHFLEVQELRMSYEAQSILMTEFNVCPVCKKRFGNQRNNIALYVTAVPVYPVIQVSKSYIAKKYHHSLH